MTVVNCLFWRSEGGIKKRDAAGISFFYPSLAPPLKKLANRHPFRDLLGY